MVLNAAHIHLMLNHVPILGFAFGLFILLWGRWRKSDDVIRAALALFFLVGLAGVAVFFSGENAEEIVEGLAGVSREAIEVHEEAGETAMIAALVMGLVSGIALLRYWARPLPSWVSLAIGAGALIAFAFLSYAGFRGGFIHHEEIRPATVGATAYPVPERSFRLNLESSVSNSS